MTVGRSKFLGFAAAIAVAAMAGSAAQAATLKASYLFNNSLSSSVGGAPDLVLTDPTGTSGYVLDNVYGDNRTVLAIRGDNSNAHQAGLTFDSTGLLTTDSWSVALTFEFFDRQNAWRRIVDVTERLSDNGFYVDPGNQLDVFPVSGSSVAWTNGVYRNVVLTVGPTGANNVTAYIDGVGSFSTTTDIMQIQSNGLINLFLDNIVAGGQNEWSTANIAVAKFYDGVLTADEVGDINDNPTAPGAVPEPASWAMMIGGLGLVGAAMRRRAAAVRFA